MSKVILYIMILNTLLFQKEKKKKDVGEGRDTGSWKGRRCRSCHPSRSKTIIFVIAVYQEARVLEVFIQRFANAFQSWPTISSLFEFWTLALEEIGKMILYFYFFFSETSK